MPNLTVGELIEKLSLVPKDWEVWEYWFGGEETGDFANFDFMIDRIQKRFVIDDGQAYREEERTGQLISFTEWLKEQDEVATT